MFCSTAGRESNREINMREEIKKTGGRKKGVSFNPSFLLLGKGGEVKKDRQDT